MQINKHSCRADATEKGLYSLIKCLNDNNINTSPHTGLFQMFTRCVFSQKQSKTNIDYEQYEVTYWYNNKSSRVDVILCFTHFHLHFHPKNGGFWTSKTEVFLFACTVTWIVFQNINYCKKIMKMSVSCLQLSSFAAAGHVIDPVGVNRTECWGEYSSSGYLQPHVRWCVYVTMISFIHDNMGFQQHRLA